MLNKQSMRKKMQNNCDVTLHTDDTTRKRKGYITTLAPTASGTVGMNLYDIESETAEALLKDTQETLRD